MKKSFMGITALCLLCCALAWADGLPTKFYVWMHGQYTSFEIDSDTLSYGDGTLTIKGQTYNLAEVDSITFSEPQDVPDVPDIPVTDEQIDTLWVAYNGNTAILSALPTDGSITATVDGADVVVNNTIEDREMVCVLSGASTSGSFVYNGTYKTTLCLNGLSLKGSVAEAINVKCGKRVALELPDGTVNVLEDASTDGGQKAAFYTKGHLEISGGGELALVGNVKHALSSKEYLLVKKSAGTIRVSKARGDGIHAGQYVQINGGDVTVKGVGGDGIQAELAADKTEDDGKIIVKGGKLDITVTADDCAALKADSTLHVKDGDLTLSCSGNGSKCMKSDLDVNIEGGTLNMTQSGGLYQDNGEEEKDEPVEQKSYKVYVSIPTSGGGGMGGWGGQTSNAWTTVYLYKNDGTLVEKLTNTVQKSSGNQTATFYYYDFKQSDSGTYYFKSDDYKSRNGNTTYAIRSNTFTGPTNGSDQYYTISSSYSTSGTTRTYSISNTTSTWANGTTGTTSVDFSSSHGIKGDGGVSISGGTLTMKLTGTASKGISTSKNILITDGQITINNSGAGQANGSDALTAKALTADGNIAIEGGVLNITMSGTGGKGIKSDGTLTIGKQQTSSTDYLVTALYQGPSLTVSTTGAKLSTGSTGGNTGGWGGPGGGSSGSSAKAIKAQGAISVYGGNLNVSTSTDGAEGLESKTSVTILGGSHYMKCYDDCINSSGNLYFNGGATVCYSYGNDAVDSNAGRSGAITIGNGAVFAYTSKGSPEEGLDCDNNSYIVINGKGFAVSAGGSQGGGGSSSIGSASQGYYLGTSSISYTAGRYYTLADASGNNLGTYKFDANVSSTLSLFTAAGMAKSVSHTVKYSTTAPTDAKVNVNGALFLGSSAKGTTSTTSFTSK